MEIEWTKELETGYPELDEQHKRLFEMIKRMTVYIEAPVIDDAKVNELVGFLETYAREHFACEERCMTKTNCPSRDLNVEAHRLFLEGIMRFKKDFADHDQKREFVAILQASMNGWLRNHIRHIDGALRGYPPSPAGAQ